MTNTLLPAEIPHVEFTNPQYCQSCSREIPTLTPVQEAADPKEGDHSVCYYCGRFLLWSKQWIGMTREHFDALAPEYRQALLSVVLTLALTDRPFTRGGTA